MCRIILILLSCCCGNCVLCKGGAVRHHHGRCCLTCRCTETGKLRKNPLSPFQSWMRPLKLCKMCFLFCVQKQLCNIYVCKSHYITGIVSRKVCQGKILFSVFVMAVKTWKKCTGWAEFGSVFRSNGGFFQTVLCDYTACSRKNCAKPTVTSFVKRC